MGARLWASLACDAGAVDAERASVRACTRAACLRACQHAPMRTRSARAHALRVWPSQAVLEVIKAGATDTVTMVIKRELASSKKSGFGVVQRT